MKVIVTQENLSRALQVVGRVASGKTPLPVLNNVLLKAEDNRLLLAATNLELAITQFIGGKIEEAGSVTIPARLTSEFVSNLPKGNVELVTDGAKTHITCGAYTSTINGIVAEEFPELPSIEEVQTVTVPTLLLKRAIQQTVVAASGDDTRPVLTGIYCHTHDGHLYFAGTDGYRLAERRLVQTDQNISAVIPVSTMNDVLRVMSDDISEAKLEFDENQVRILLDDIEITSRLIDGNFPNYRSLIPKKLEGSATIAKDEFARITRVASLFARESGGSVTLKTNAEAGKLNIHSVASQLGENTSEAEAEVTADGQVTLNSRYLLEALGCVDSKQVVFRFGDKLSPCIITPSGETDYMHVVMPLKS